MRFMKTGFVRVIPLRWDVILLRRRLQALCYNKACFGKVTSFINKPFPMSKSYKELLWSNACKFQTNCNYFYENAFLKFPCNSVTKRKVAIFSYEYINVLRYYRAYMLLNTGFPVLERFLSKFVVSFNILN